MSDTLDEIFHELDAILTEKLRTKLSRPDFSLRECYASSRDEPTSYFYAGVFADPSYELSPNFAFYAVGEVNEDTVGASAVVDGRGLIATPENLFWIRQAFDDKYDAMQLRGHIKPIVIEVRE